MKTQYTFMLSLTIIIATVLPSAAEQYLTAVYTNDAPVIDGLGADPVWQNGPLLTTHDTGADIPINIRAVYTDTDIYFLVSFPDPDESRTHKSWVWNKGRQMYTVGYDREDIFVMKWNMEDRPVNLSIYSDDTYRADIWYWKACRTDAGGYADDKIQTLKPVATRDSLPVDSKSGKTMYLTRTGDEGQSAYSVSLTSEYAGDILARYIIQQPSGSRADIQAKGGWQDGTWTIEFSRKLVTGHDDDIQFSPGKKYLFGVSRYEIAGRKPNAKLSDPLYGTGDVNETLWLEFRP